MKYYGKYKAYVKETTDPLKRGRVKVECPRISKDYISDWAEICTPFSFSNGGIHFELVKDELVWVEFEEGDLDKPIVTGCIWASNEAPLTGVDNKRVIITPSGHTLDFDDGGKIITLRCANKNEITLTPEGIKIKDKNSNTITMNSSGITLDTPKVLNIKSKELTINSGNVAFNCDSMDIN